MMKVIELRFIISTATGIFSGRRTVPFSAGKEGLRGFKICAWIPGGKDHEKKTLDRSGAREAAPGVGTFPLDFPK